MSGPVELDAERIFETLTRHRVRYVVIGGYAAVLYGLARATEDVDVEYVSRRSLRVTGFPAAGDNDVTVLLRRGAVRVSDRSQNLLRRGRNRTFAAKVKQTPVSGAATSTRGKFRARGSR